VLVQISQAAAVQELYVSGSQDVATAAPWLTTVFVEWPSQCICVMWTPGITVIDFIKTLPFIEEKTVKGVKRWINEITDRRTQTSRLLNASGGQPRRRHEHNSLVSRNLRHVVAFMNSEQEDKLAWWERESVDILTFERVSHAGWLRVKRRCSLQLSENFVPSRLLELLYSRRHVARLTACSIVERNNNTSVFFISRITDK